MNENNEQSITLANNSISNAIKDSVKNEIEATIVGNASFTNAPELLESIKTIEDPIQKAELYKKYMSMLDDHQKVKNDALSKLIENGIEKSKKNLDSKLEEKKIILDTEIEKDKARTSIFTNRSFLIFLMCFPIIISILVIIVSKSFVFAAFIILMWYGMILALYFSQSDALNKLLQNFPLKKEP